MELSKIYEYLDRVGVLTFSTIYNGEVHSRIAHFNGYDDEGIYFRTMANKPYGRQLMETQKLTVCGHYGKGILNHEELGAVPEFAPGYTIRLVGDIRHVPSQEIIQKAETNKMLEVAARDITLYPAMRDGNFVLYRAKGELYEYDFEKVNRSHKLLRTRFAFGGADFNQAGLIIGEGCIGCGICYKTCSFDAIESVGNKYKVNPNRCDECGSCMLKCPVGAISESLVF